MFEGRPCVPAASLPSMAITCRSRSAAGASVVPRRASAVLRMVGRNTSSPTLRSSEAMPLVDGTQASEAPPPGVFRRIRLQRRHGSSESGGVGMVPVFHVHRRMPCGCPRPVDMAVPPYPLSDDRTCSTAHRRIPIAAQAAWQPSLVLRRICEGIPDVACGHVPQDSSKIREPSCRSGRLPRNLPLYNPLRLSVFIGYHRRR